MPISQPILAEGTQQGDFWAELVDLVLHVFCYFLDVLNPLLLEMPDCEVYILNRIFHELLALLGVD